MATHPYTRLFPGKTVAPGVSNDITEGFEVGDIWIDETGGAAYVALDVTDGAAVWQEAGGSAGMPNPFALTADISPAALTADVDNYNPTGLSTADVLRLTTDGSDYSVNGLAGGADGRILIILNVSAGNVITLADEAGTSTAGNRFSLTIDIPIFPNRAAIVIYDATLSRWREIASTDAATVQGALFSANLASAIEGYMLVFTSGGYFEAVPSADVVDGYLLEAIQDAVGAMFSGNTETGISATYQDADGTIDLEVTGSGIVSGPQGFGDNYVITPSVATNDLTVALKTIAGADPSAGDPITIRIGNTKQTITAALSVTKLDGTNWCNLGSTEHAGQDVDLFVYLIQETGASAGTKIGFSRIPYARVMGDFVNTSTNEKYIAGSWTNFNATDEVENIGRFNASLSASASFNWSIPATPIVINRPIFRTRRLVCNSVWVGWTTPPTVDLNYIVDWDNVLVYVLATGSTASNSTTATETLPFTCATITDFLIRNSTSGRDNGTIGTTPCMASITSGDNKIVFYKDFAANTWTNSGNKQIFSTELIYPLR